MNRTFLYTVLLVLGCVIAGRAEEVETVVLPAWELPAGAESVEVFLGHGRADRRGWGGYSPQERRYFHDPLPALFQRTLVLETVENGRAVEWVFTGPRAAFDLRIEPRRVRVVRRQYDSFAFNHGRDPGRHPEIALDGRVFVTETDIEAVTVSLNRHLELAVALNGKRVYGQTFREDLRRHQLRLAREPAGKLELRMVSPGTGTAAVQVHGDRPRQKILGFGGITTPTAYHELSSRGKRRWFEYVAEYNLLCQREYPVGGALSESLDNWERLEDAKAHYYGDNFPNGEVSDFGYNRLIQELGGFVMFEFWDLPPWIGDDASRYTEAMVGYCRAARERTGRAPRIVGVQNEVGMPAERVGRFVPALREALDEAGFADVRIHMANATSVAETLRRLPGYLENPEVWTAIDYAATNMYDFQRHFTDLDGFDEVLARFREVTGSRPFLSTEICINDPAWQLDSYAVSLPMGQLYHKNFAVAEASMLCYCWTLLNTEQASYGYSRALFVTDPENGFVPTPSSNQFRVFGAWSRRVHAGMERLESMCDHPDLLVTAFADPGGGRSTLVALNRSQERLEVKIDWTLAGFTTREDAGPYSPNLVRAYAPGEPVVVDPGAIVTLTNVELHRLPEGFAIPQ